MVRITDVENQSDPNTNIEYILYNFHSKYTLLEILDHFLTIEINYILEILNKLMFRSQES